MKFDIQLNVCVEAETEKEAIAKLFDFLRYSKNHCGSDYGFEEWELLEWVMSDDEYNALGV